MIKVKFVDDEVSIYDEKIQATPLVTEVVSRTISSVKDIEEGDDLATGEMYVFAPRRNNGQLVKKIYLGINNLAHKIYDAPTGIGYVGVGTPLNEGMWGMAGTTIGDYGLVGGGATYFDHIGSLAIYAYDSNLIRTMPGELYGNTAYPNFQSIAAANKNYAIFGGGRKCEYNEEIISYKTAYDGNLSKTNLSQAGTYPTDFDRAASSVGEYALLLDARSSRNIQHSDIINVYNNTLTLSQLTNNYEASFATASVNNYAFFIANSGSRPIVIYDEYLTLTTINNYLYVEQLGVATNAGNNIVVAGAVGRSSSPSPDVFSINNDFTISLQSALSVGRTYIGATNINGVAIFAGGRSGEYITSNVTDMYDEQLTRSQVTGLSEGREWPAATTIGNYAIFVGGETYTSASYWNAHDSDVVDIYRGYPT